MIIVYANMEIIFEAKIGPNGRKLSRKIVHAFRLMGRNAQRTVVPA